MCGATAPSLLSLPTTSGERAQCRQPFYMENIFYREHILFGVRAMSPPRPCPSLSAVVGESERAREREREREPAPPPPRPACLPPSLPRSLPLPGAHPLHTLEATSATGPSRSHRMCSLTRICSPRGTSFAHARSHKCYRPLTVLTFRANFLAAQWLGLSGIFYFILFYFILFGGCPVAWDRIDISLDNAWRGCLHFLGIDYAYTSWAYTMHIPLGLFGISLDNAWRGCL
jgi:hypothetical protein